MNPSSARLVPEHFAKSVASLLSREEIAALEELGDTLHPNERLSLATFLNLLFARATVDPYQTHTPKEIAGVVSGCLKTIASIPAEPDRIALNFSHDSESARLFLALDDHPFIISSVAETLSDADIKVRSFLHPIVRSQDRSIAVSYIEIDSHSVERVVALLPRVREMLRNLTQVGRDFSPMKQLADETARRITTDPLNSTTGEAPAAEISELLSWLNDGCFFFLGAATGSIDRGLDSSSFLGIWHSTNSYTTHLHLEVNEDIQTLSEKKLRFSIRKLRLTSRIHRHATLVHVLVQPSKSTPHFASFVGYLTSKAWSHEAQEVPFLRIKLDKVMSLEGAIPNSHDYKYIAEVVDNMPTDEALVAPISQLATITRLALGIFSQEETSSITSVDEVGRRAFTTVILPPERYSAAVQSTLQEILETTLRAEPYSSEVHLDSSKKRQFRLYLSTPLPEQSAGVSIPEDLSARLINATLPWDEILRSATAELEISASPDGIFPDDYKAATEIPEAIHDLLTLDALSQTNSVAVSLYSDGSETSRPILSIFSVAKEISISLAAPVLENVGLEVLSAHSYECSSSFGPAHLLKLRVRPYDGETLSAVTFNAAVSSGIAKVLQGNAPNDPLNQLLRKVPVTIQQIAVLRLYCALLWQVHKISTKRTMWEALSGAPRVALQLWRIFDWRFNPTLSITLTERGQRASLEESLLVEALREVKDITQDRVLRALLALMRSTVRTNYFTGSETLAVKLRSQEIEFMPHPRPLFEIFVFSSRIEGTHLRSARVARGGIRWSERLDDYRAEVLGLMKTQRVKNVIIVPSGAKGGFVVKNIPRQPELASKAVEQGYREYITALLTLADNEVNGSVVHPAQVVVHDDPDPYFVVAADKGTATFSDVANSIAQNEFGFWLDDAFASGGSAGYDHKKHGITARGGWQCVVRHFRDLGINYETEPFTVVGLGDMSGDVFGNGLLVNRNMALIAAFNHKHIFIDPNPDLAKAFDERTRLFTLRRSQWSDFNPAIISRGGGVFDRFDKEIGLTQELRAALSIPDDVPNVVDGERLISLILQSKVDLIWNGGIGTYVKARSESHADVNDGTNDGVRVNADELRARVIGEGGNLGLTQRARIEFALRGGRINTDAIDNSGGVDLSDHEVNLKLLFAPLISSGQISREGRNDILTTIAPGVVESVLRHNSDQALLLSSSHILSKTRMEQYRYLIREMHRRGYLDRNRDALPDEAEIDDRSAKKEGLTRPELAICSAAVKMWVKDELRPSKLCADQSLERFLLKYFPPLVAQTFRAEVLHHPLRNDIIASEVVSEILPVVGISFIHSLASLNGSPIPTTMKCILAADTILGGDSLRARLHGLDTPTQSGNFTRLWLDMGSAVREASEWLLTTHGATHSLQEIVNLYASDFQTLTSHSNLVFTGKELSRFERRVAEYRELGASNAEAVVFALYRRILPLLEVLWASREFSCDVRVVASTYSQVLEELRINELFKFEHVIETQSKWEQELVAGSYQEIRRGLSLITGQIVTRGIRDPESVRHALLAATGYEAIRSTMADLEELTKQKRPFQLAALPVITRQLRLFTL